MTQQAAEPTRTLACRLAPSGEVRVFSPPATGRSRAFAPEVADRIAAAFARGRGHGVLHLGAAELETELDPSLGFWRDLGRHFVAAACGALDPNDPQAVVAPEPEEGLLESLAAAVPPMTGAELVTPGLLAEVWQDASSALAREARRRKGGVQAYLEAHDSAWNVVGRVCFHVAENKDDPEHPFAFIATYVRHLSRRARPQYVPLGHALEEYAGARNRRKLLALLAPLQRAAERSELVRELVDSGDVYHPLAWTAAEAHAFLCEVERFEQAGVVVRLPDWWSARSRPRPVVRVTVGSRVPSRLGQEALLDFDVGVTLGGERLTRREIERLLAASEGLVLVKGRWVEVDREKLEQVLAAWHAVEQSEDGLGFAEAMRLLAGADLDDTLPGEDAEARPEWSEVVAGKWLADRLESLRAPAVRAEVERGAGLEAELRPYQKEGIAWLHALHGLELGGCLADDMGLGKTLQVLGLLSLLRRAGKRMPRRKAAKPGATGSRDGEHGPDLLVVPASLIDNWLAEARRFAPRLRILVAHPSRIPTRELRALPASELAGHDAVLTTYGTVLRTDWMREHPWRCVVLDEAQAIKNPGAKQTRAVKALPARFRLALTGTPVENRLGDLWSIFDFLNPGLLGSARAFGRFCGQLEKRDEDAFGPLRRLVGPYILRRLKTDRRVIADLPEKTEVTAHCLLARRQAALYQQAVGELARALHEREGIERRGVVLAFLTRFKQICNHPSHWLGDGAWAERDSGKLARLRELCEPIAGRQEKLLVFTQFREMTGPLADFLEGCFGRPGLVMHGGTPVRRRQALVRRFQQDDDAPYMVLSLKVGGTGLNLTAASHVVHFDRWWNPALESQATDRAFRIGQRRNVLVHKFVCKGTVEERIDELIAGKQALSEQVLSEGAEPRLTEMSDDELLGFVALDLKSAVAS